MTAVFLVLLLCGVPASAYAKGEPALQGDKISDSLLQEKDRLQLCWQLCKGKSPAASRSTTARNILPI